ncbi:MAG: VIT1/CCC1 family predicted Fe2+/Mn2+ transporter [Candidatus Poriferisodalaceae bacterium]|jgi:vacuolar iron transporter family protein
MGSTEHDGGEHHHHEEHANVQGGFARAAVFGASDGLVSNVLLIIGMSGAEASGSVVRTAGIAGLLAGAISMASGEYVSVRAQNELVERELDRERTALSEHPEHEAEELAQLYVDRGMTLDQARTMSEQVMADPDVALEVHAREELGVTPGELASPWTAAASSFVAFVIGAFIPLLPWLFSEGGAATWASVVLGVLGAAGIGLGLAVLTGRSIMRNVSRHVVIAVSAAVVTYFIGGLVGKAV